MEKVARKFGWRSAKWTRLRKTCVEVSEVDKVVGFWVEVNEVHKVVGVWVEVSELDKVMRFWMEVSEVDKVAGNLGGG